MGLFEHFPYTNFHDLNLNWIIGKIKNIETAEQNAAESAESAQQSADAAQASALTAQEAAVNAQESAEDSASEAARTAGTAVTLRSEMNILNSRISNIVASGTPTEGNAELLDIRVAADGHVYPLAGDAVRGQIEQINAGLEAEYLRPNLFQGAVSAGYAWNCWTATCYQEAVEGKSCFEFQIPLGTTYISSNGIWANNSFSAFVTDDYTKIGLMRDYLQSGDGYIYGVPASATKVLVTINSSDDLSNIVFIPGSRDIRTATGADYPNEDRYYADSLLIHDYGTVEDLKNEVISLGFTGRKNLFAGINPGHYVSSWNIGDAVTINDAANYAYGVADVSGCSQVSVNLSNLSNTFSFFTNANNRKVATIEAQQIGTTRSYTVPEGAKYLYISSSDYSTWQQYGFVLLEGTEDISTDPASASTFPYMQQLYYADNVRLMNGQTLGSLEMPPVYHVEKNGTGDFTTITDAIRNINDNDIMDATVYIGAGEWDIADELGPEYMEAVTSDPSTWGLVLRNRIHLIGSSNSTIKCFYTGTNTNTHQYFSVFNAGKYGFTLENLNIEDDNIRYTIHDDRGGDSHNEMYSNKYINCSMKHTNGMYSDCIGGGLGINGMIEIRNCYFEGSANVDRLVYYHGNNYAGETNAKCKIIVDGNYFAGRGTFGLTKYGDSTKVSTAYVSNNSIGSPLFVNSGSYAPQNNMQLIDWNNVIRI